MYNAKIVIGANYGDEGKGISTDYLAQNWADIVVRFNGGAQAAHTVHRDCFDSIHSHVFGHVGSASLQEIPTYLGPKFVVNPVLFCKEIDKLQRILSPPPIFMHPDCYVSTMFDMLINKIMHYLQKQNRTCGVGFNETITRCYDNSLPLQVKDLYEEYERKIKDIKKYYLPARLYQLGLTHKEIVSILKCYDLKYMEKTTIISIEKMKQYVREIITDSLLSAYDNVLFEGAQGLALDEINGAFPYVTRSRTGLKNALEIIETTNPNSSIDVYYVTRAYNTRHGSGPFDFEGDTPKWVQDETNIPNEYQGSLRYAPLDITSMAARINFDYASLQEGREATKNMIVTCMDQVPTKVQYVERGKYKYANRNDFLNAINSSINCSKMLVNYSKVTPVTMGQYI